jgi:hypothetical protein
MFLFGYYYFDQLYLLQYSFSPLPDGVLSISGSLDFNRLFTSKLLLYFFVALGSLLMFVFTQTLRGLVTCIISVFGITFLFYFISVIINPWFGFLIYLYISIPFIVLGNGIIIFILNKGLNPKIILTLSLVFGLITFLVGYIQISDFIHGVKIYNTRVFNDYRYNSIIKAVDRINDKQEGVFFETGSLLDPKAVVNEVKKLKESYIYNVSVIKNSYDCAHFFQSHYSNYCDKKKEEFVKGIDYTAEQDLGSILNENRYNKDILFKMQRYSGEWWNASNYYYFMRNYLHTGDITDCEKITLDPVPFIGDTITRENVLKEAKQYKESCVRGY